MRGSLVQLKAGTGQAGHTCDHAGTLTAPAGHTAGRACFQQKRGNGVLTITKDPRPVTALLTWVTSLPEPSGCWKPRQGREDAPPVPFPLGPLGLRSTQSYSVLLEVGNQEASKIGRARPRPRPLRVPSPQRRAQHTLREGTAPFPAACGRGPGGSTRGPRTTPFASRLQLLSEREGKGRTGPGNQCTPNLATRELRTDSRPLVLGLIVSRPELPWWMGVWHRTIQNSLLLQESRCPGHGCRGLVGVRG